jgi:alanine dehydrogenase
MVVGVPRERKVAEKRVALIPTGCRALTSRGHTVLIEAGAGEGSGFDDDEYIDAGAEINPAPDQVFCRADLIVKVKDPLPAESAMLRKGQILFTYLHLAASRQLTLDLVAKGVVAVAYETIELDDGSLPLLIPMSEIAGRMAPQEGAKYLEKQYGGRGVLLSGVPGVPPANVVVLGAGTVGLGAVRIAAGMGADVTLLDVIPAKLRSADISLWGKVRTMIADEHNLAVAIRFADLVIGAVLVHGAKAPRLISRESLKAMKRGAVLVDVAIDQGGCAETSRPTTHTDPIYVEEGVIHYAVSNMPGAVPRTATRALTLNTLPYILLMADKGWRDAVRQNRPLAMGVNVVEGAITYHAVADAFGLPFRQLADLL